MLDYSEGIAGLLDGTTSIPNEDRFDAIYS